MVAASCSREKAERPCGGSSRTSRRSPSCVDRAENVREKEEQAFIAKLFRGFGCKVYNLSQARASKQTPGLPDLWVVHLEAKLAFWFESSARVGGKLSAAAARVPPRVRAAPACALLGDRRAAAKILARQGLARVGDGPCGIVPFHEGR
jgi:hypothetical protein